MATNFKDLRTEIQSQIKPNGVGAITGQVMQDAMLNLVGATEGELSALRTETGEELAQLSQEWQEIKDANFNVVVNPHVEKIDMGATSAANLEPDKFYIWTNPVSAIAITLNPQMNPQYVAQYLFQFTCPAESATSLSLPVDVVWNEVPTIKAGKTYQVSILERLAIITAWN